MDHWTIEVLHGEFSAQLWQDAHGDALVESAQTRGALDWTWSSHSFGVVLELAFADEADWLRFRALPAVRAALDAVPDREAGLLVYHGRGGASGARVPRRPLAPLSSGAAALPLPDPGPVEPEVPDAARVGLARSPAAVPGRLVPL